MDKEQDENQMETLESQNEPIKGNKNVKRQLDRKNKL